MGDYVVRYRKGQPIQVSKQILRWRAKRKKAEKLKAEEEAKLVHPLDRKIFE